MNVTIADNVRSNAGTITGSGIYAESAATVAVTNSISWNNNSGDEVSVSSATANINYSCIRNGYAGTGNISSNPVFISPTDYHLQITSPCINAGTLAGAPAFDLENNPRPQPALTNPDMGCYEIDQVITGADDFPLSAAINIYPNPAADKLYVTRYMLYDNCAVEIYNVIGNLVFSQKPTANSQQQLVLDISDLEKGIYFCRISSGNETGTVTFVKQ